MHRFITGFRGALRRAFDRHIERVDRAMCASSTHTALRHYWLDPLDH